MNSRLVRFAVRYKLLLWSSVALGTIFGGLLLFCILLNIEIEIKWLGRLHANVFVALYF